LNPMILISHSIEGEELGHGEVLATVIPTAISHGLLIRVV
jgi:hypothetical protein